MTVYILFPIFEQVFIFLLYKLLSTDLGLYSNFSFSLVYSDCVTFLLSRIVFKFLIYLYFLIMIILFIYVSLQLTEMLN